MDLSDGVYMTSTNDIAEGRQATHVPFPAHSKYRVVTEGEVKKLVDLEKNAVAVLYSPGFGAGWSTWSSGKLAEYCTFDPEVAVVVMYNANNKHPEVFSKWVEEKYEAMFSNEDGKGYFYSGGGDDLRVFWLPKGVRFEIEEYDGNESIRQYDDVQFLRA